MASPSDIPPATLLAGKIRLIQRIGRGGMGDVWVARNEATHAEVAVKTLQKEERTPEHDQRFRREARLAATVSHRNVVRVFDLVDEADGTLALVMELLRGGTLEACNRERGPLSTMQAIAVASAILSALNHVHEKGIVHRDVKPSNIFFAVEPDGHVIPKIIDFGIAKLPAVTSSLTVDGSVLGTPHHMAPEQIRGATDIDGRSDMFSLATVLYEMLTGERPFERDSAAASLAAVLEHQVDPDPRIEPRVWLAISRALAKRPYERFATCAEFAETLRAAVDASDEDFAAALQELRPRSDAIPESDITKLGALSASAQRTTAPTRKGGPWSHRWTLGAACLAAAIAVSATLVVTRKSPTARADDGAPQARALEVPAASSVPPEPTSAPSAASVASATPTPLASAPPKASTVPNRRPPTNATPPPPRPTTKPPGRPIATSPGF